MAKKASKQADDGKRVLGQFFTATNPFEIIPFIHWFEKIRDKHVIVEPFAGSGSIIDHINNIFGDDIIWKSYDIEPKRDDIIEKDTILDMPSGNLAITNPPYLGKSSATRRGLYWYKENKYDDLYKFSIDRMLKKFNYVAAIIPESFINSGQFVDRLEIVISLTTIMFEDTDCPVCLALFSPHSSQNYEIWSMNTYLGSNLDLDKFKIKSSINVKMRFNDPEGELGVRAIDGGYPNISFVVGDSIPSSKIKHSSRALTRISISRDVDIILLIDKLNEILHEYRNNTYDVFLTSFKGLRKDGKYRRRIDFKTIRDMINLAIEETYGE